MLMKSEEALWLKIALYGRLDPNTYHVGCCTYRDASCNVLPELVGTD